MKYIVSAGQGFRIKNQVFEAGKTVDETQAPADILKSLHEAGIIEPVQTEKAKK